MNLWLWLTLGALIGGGVVLILAFVFLHDIWRGMDS